MSNFNKDDMPGMNKMKFKKKEKKNSNPAGQVTYWFFMLTLFYFIIRYSVGTEGTQGLVWMIIYYLLLVLVMFNFNSKIIEEKCYGNKNLSLAVFATLVPWITIFVTLNIILTILPGWKAPFSNTLGYLVANLAGLNSVVNELFEPPGTKNNSKGEMYMSGPVAMAVERIYGNKALIVNEITPGNFESFFSSMNELFKSKYKVKGSDDQLRIKKKLKGLIILKDMVAEWLWYVLTGILTASVSTNYILSQNCNLSVKELEQRARDIQNQRENDESMKRNYVSSE